MDAQVLWERNYENNLDTGWYSVFTSPQRRKPVFFLRISLKIPVDRKRSIPLEMSGRHHRGWSHRFGSCMGPPQRESRLQHTCGRRQGRVWIDSFTDRIDRTCQGRRGNVANDGKKTDELFWQASSSETPLTPLDLQVRCKESICRSDVGSQWICSSDVRSQEVQQAELWGWWTPKCLKTKCPSYTRKPTHWLQ